MRPQSQSDHRAIQVAYARFATGTDLLVNKIMVMVAGAAALLVLAISSDIGWHLAARQLALCAAAGSYFGLCWYLLTHGYAHKASWVRWVNATVEPTFVTVSIWVVYASHGSSWATATPAFSLYVLVLAVSVCRMQPALCLYAAGMGALQYLVLYYSVIEPGMSAELVAALPPLAAWAAWERVVWLLVISGVLAFATFRMRAMAFASGTETWRRQRLETEFGRYVSKDIVQAIMRGDAGVDTAERREVTVLFCDLRDFTGLCEKEAPEDVIGLLNTFYEDACKVIHAHGGTVNKFLGDGMLALFGAPDEHPNHAQAAAAAAHEILYAVDRLRGQGGMWRHLDVGIGLDTGFVVCGAVGAQSRLEYTAIGTIVNRAARLQGLTRRANRRIVLSRSCVKSLGPRANVVSFGEVKLKGFEDPVPVFAFRHS
jgi:class 3 adenylate cyclase